MMLAGRLSESVFRMGLYVQLRNTATKYGPHPCFYECKREGQQVSLKFLRNTQRVDTSTEHARLRWSRCRNGGRRRRLRLVARVRIRLLLQEKGRIARRWLL